MKIKESIKKLFKKEPKVTTEDVAKVSKSISAKVEIEEKEPHKRWSTKGTERPRTAARIKRKRKRQLARKARRITRARAA